MSDGATEFRYDAAGRRTREAGPEGERRFGWDPRGFLDQITTITRSGDKITARTQELRVDALGELSSIDGEAVTWDTAAPTPALAQIGEFSISNYGPLTALLPDASGALGGVAGDVGQWLTPGWRSRTGGADPWGVSAEAGPSGLPSGVQLGGQGNLLVEGMEWLQARVYDPASRGFLSTDPMQPVWGSGWSANPYAFAGNDPLNQTDPWGLRPVTEQELQAYRESNNGGLANAWNATTSWVKNNWEYIAAGAMIVAGVALMCTGIGGPAGIALPRVQPSQPGRRSPCRKLKTAGSVRSAKRPQWGRFPFPEQADLVALRAPLEKPPSKSWPNPALEPLGKRSRNTQPKRQLLGPRNRAQKLFNRPLRERGALLQALKSA